MDRTTESFCAVANIRALHEVGLSLSALDCSKQQRVLGEVVVKMGIRPSKLESGGARHGDSAMCCGFGVEARAGAKKLVPYSLGWVVANFFVARTLLYRAHSAPNPGHIALPPWPAGRGGAGGGLPRRRSLKL